MAEKNQKVPENKPRKKNKWLIAGGVIALVAVVVVIGVFAQRGEWFRGFVGDMSFDYDYSPQEIDYHETTTGPYFYVSANRGECADGTYLGSKECPFTSIKSAADAINNQPTLTSAEIRIAQGTYTETEGIVMGDKILNIIGGYDPDFNNNPSMANQTRVNGYFELDNVTGSLKNLYFANGGRTDSEMLDIIIANQSAAKFTLSNINIQNMTYPTVMKLGGNNSDSELIVENIYANEVTATSGAVLSIRGRTDSHIRKNFFKSCSGKNGVIYVDQNAKVYNNLITTTPEGTYSGITIDDGSDVVVANNTLDVVRGKQAAIAQKGEIGVRLYNNLVTNSPKAFDVSANTYTVARNNSASDYDSFGLDEAKNPTCNPDYVRQKLTTDPAYWKLSEDSNCINSGYSPSYLESYVSDDFFGTSRPQGDGYDIGFHEVFEMYIAPFEPLDVTPLYPEDEEEEPPADEEDPPADEADDEEEPADDEEEPADDEEEPPDDEEEPADEEEAVACGEWWDVSEDDNDFDTWMYLCEREIVRGNDDGSLRPDDNLNRAELLAIAFRASDSENIMDVDFGEDNCFPDVGEQWFAPYICTAKDEGFVEGYPDGTAKPARDVIMAEGAKMLMGALDLPFNTGSGEDWYVPILNAADENNYLPYRFNRPSDIAGMELTRRDTFDMVYRMLYSL